MLMDELLLAAIVYRLWEARIAIKRWRDECNEVRSRISLG